MNDAENALIGAVIIDAEVDGYRIRLVLDNGKTFYYEATDGGYSCWDIEEKRHE